VLAVPGLRAFKRRAGRPGTLLAGFAGGMPVRIKRVYDQASAADGRRILVDRVWPRGLSKEAARVDEWLRDLAPSSELRKRFGHDPSRHGQLTPGPVVCPLVGGAPGRQSIRQPR
jgi:hypothetical protein